jgi:hypothetical protein
MVRLATRAGRNTENLLLRAHAPLESIHSSFQAVHSFVQAVHPLLKMPYVPTDSDFDPAYFRADGVGLRTDQVFYVSDSGVAIDDAQTDSYHREKQRRVWGDEQIHPSNRFYYSLAV